MPDSPEDWASVNALIEDMAARFRAHLDHGGPDLVGTGAELDSTRRAALTSFIDRNPDLYDVIYRAGFVGCASLMINADEASAHGRHS